MGVGYNKKDPLDNKRIHLHSLVVDIFRRHQWLGFFELLKGYDDDLAFEFSMDLNSQIEDNATIVVRGLTISLSPETISRVTTLPIGIKWSREEMFISVTNKNNLFIANEKPIEDKNGVWRENLPYPWDEVAYHILKYISYEGRMTVVYSYHFRLLHELNF